jgi:membrane-associated phospholipid phosphatase
MDILHNILFTIGEYSPVILSIPTLTLLYNKPTLYYYYIFGLVINSMLNITLKLLIKEPRPQPQPSSRLKNANANANKNENTDTSLTFSNLAHFDNYGMPSGHAQIVFFSSIYIWLAFKNIKISLVYLCVSLITLYQRVKYNKHTISQVIVGSIIGSLMAALTYFFFKKKIVGILKFKPDDNFKISSIGSNL